MKYLWEIVLQADKEGIPLNSLSFVHGARGSAYMELVRPFLNDTTLGQGSEIEINTYYRFYSIFCELFGPEQKEFPALTKCLTNVILHMLAENDVRSGMTKAAYYRKLLSSDLRAERFGYWTGSVFLGFTREEQEIVLNGLLRSYQVGNSLTIFTDMIHGLLKGSIVYHSNDCPEEIIIYVKQKKTYSLEQKLQLLIDLFLEISYHVDIFYEYHFGIIGIDATMRIDEIAVY